MTQAREGLARPQPRWCHQETSSGRRLARISQLRHFWGKFSVPGRITTVTVTTRMNETLSVVDETTQLINQVSHSSKEQSYGIDQVNIAVSQMGSNLQQNAAMVEQMSAAASSLSQQAGRLLAEVSSFKL